MFKHIKISNTLLAVVLAFVVLQALLGGLGYWTLSHINERVQTLYQSAIVQTNTVNAATLELITARTDLSRYSSRVAQQQADQNSTLLSAREQIAAADARVATLKQGLSAEDLDAMGPFLAAYQRYSDNLKGVDRVLTAGDMQAYMKQGTQKVQDSYMTARDAFVANAERFGQSTMQRIASYYTLFVAVLTVTLIISLLVAVGANVIVRRLIVRPLLTAGELFKRIAAGDLTCPVEADGRNEIGALLRSLRDMQDSLVGLVAQVREGVQEIHLSTREISAGNTDLSSRTEEQAASLQETAASMEQLSATVKQNAEHAYRASTMVKESSGVAEQGGEAVDGVIQTMGTIADSSSHIAEIVGVIDNIAFQTNILALNAAVEAARAGEQGKGFAVVAAEVRSLAQSSAAAAREIKTLIDDSVQKVAGGTQQVGTAGDTIRQVVDSVAQVTRIMADISTASQEQASGIEQVNTAISQMDSVTQQNAALVEQAAAAAQALQDQAQHLARAVALFKLPQPAAIPGGALVLS
ncbi:methyl-accepting chemotaxis protein [Castellaniella sp.]|uniref:methyl-accepting chemotaxis protein n=1 Tax=Castellaniella sp. TaxID=1955812 RepID=UPI003C745E2F